MRTQRHPIVQADLEEIVASEIDFEAFAGKTTLITGASGFLPAYMVETLLFLNDRKPDFKTEVLALVRDRERAERRFARYRGRADLKFIHQDVSAPIDPGTPVHFVIHAASQASPKYFGRDPVGTLLPNILGTRNLLELGRSQPLEKFLFFSSGEVYGIVDPLEIPTRENQYGRVDPTQVRSCYAESKRMGETMCVAWAHQFGVPARIVRPFHTYGPGMLLDDGRVFSDFVANILGNRDIEMKSDGAAIRAYCYLADATRGFFKVLLDGQNAEAYNIGNDQAETSVLGLAETLIGLFPEKKLKVLRKAEDKTASDYLPSPIPRNCPDIAKARTLGWTPRHSIASGFSRTIRSFL